MANYTCIICFEEFSCGFTKPNFEVCLNCLKEHVKTNKCINLYTNGGNFHVYHYEWCFDGPFKEWQQLAKTCREEEERLEKIRNKQIIIDTLNQFELNYRKINQTLILYKAETEKIKIVLSNTVANEINKFFEELTNVDHLLSEADLIRFIDFVKVFATDPYIEAYEDLHDYLLEISLFKSQKIPYNYMIKQIHRWIRTLRKTLRNSEIVDERVNQGRCDHCDQGIYYNFKCNRCTSVKCNNCGLTYKESSHTCNEADKRAYSVDKLRFKNCPKCYVPIERTEGCPDMWCKNCHTMFNWNTLELIKQPRHNPDRIDYMRRLRTQNIDELIIDYETYINLLDDVKSSLFNDYNAPSYSRLIITNLEHLVNLIDDEFCGKFYRDRDESNVLRFVNSKYTLTEIETLSRLFGVDMEPDGVDQSITIGSYEQGKELIDKILPRIACIFQLLSGYRFYEGKKLYKKFVKEFSKMCDEISASTINFTSSFVSFE